MSLLKLFFSFYGRVGRTIYWCGSAICLIALAFVPLIGSIVAYLLTGGFEAGAIATSAMRVAAVPTAISIVAFHVRRLHDCGLSAWWLIPAFTVIGFSGRWIMGATVLLIKRPADGLLVMSPALVLLSVTFFLIGGIAGTVGPNRYGPDPHDELRGNA